MPISTYYLAGVAAASCLLIGTNVSTATTLIDHDFQQQVVDGNSLWALGPAAAVDENLFGPYADARIGPAYIQHSMPAFGSVEIVDSTSVIPDPFGGVGNQSMMIQDDAPYAVPAVAFKGTIPGQPSGFTSGTLSFDLYLPDDGQPGEVIGFNSPYVDFRFGPHDSQTGLVQQPAVWFTLQKPRENSGPSITVYEGLWGSPTPPYQVDNFGALAVNTVLNVEVDIDASTHSYTIDINGVPVTNLGSPNFAFADLGLGQPDYLNFMHFQTDGAHVNNRVFIDNLLLVDNAAPAIDGDLDGDGFVGIADLNIVLGNWNQAVPPGDPLADPSGDGFVGIEDLNTVLGNWNAGTPPTDSGAIPEPASLALLGLGCWGVLRRR